jgi:hypothetical protein
MYVATARAIWLVMKGVTCCLTLRPLNYRKNQQIVHPTVKVHNHTLPVEIYGATDTRL